MASIRRTLSPAFQDRPYVNGGGSPFSVPSPSQKLLSSSRYSPPFPSSILAFSVSVRSFVAGVLFHRPNRKGQQWRRGFYRCLLFFFLGFLLGLLPFGHVDDDEIRGRSFNFDIKPPHVNVQLDTDNTDRAVKRMNVQFNTDNADRAEKRRNVQFDTDNADRAEKRRNVQFDTDNADRAEKRRNVQFDTDNADRAEKRRNVQFDTDNADRTVKRREDLVDVRLGVVERRVDLVPRKLLIIVMPTYNRALQAYFLNRLGQLLGLVPRPLLWIVVETNAASMETAEILRKSGVMYRHLVCGNNSTRAKDRGVYQRNTALEHIERHRLDGIVYFADDDNIYSLDLFDRLRDISRFGTWPVAMLAQSKNKAILEGPVCNRSQVVGWHTNEKSKRLRRFHVDMSGFAFNSTILWDPKRWHRPTSAAIRQLDTVKEGFQETTFIEQVVEDESQMEGTPAGCSKVMNWHLHLEVHSLVYPKGWQLAKNLAVVLPIER